MKSLSVELIAAGAAVAALAYFASRPGAAAAAGKAAGGALVAAADGAVSGVVVGAGALVGIPETNADQCTADLAAGNLWAASFSCPAPRYLRALAGLSDTPPASTGGTSGSW
jgi:hypothetical protein